MERKACLNLKPVKANSVTHNFRVFEKMQDDEKKNIFKEHSHQNEYWNNDHIGARRQFLEQLYKDKVGQKMQSNSVPIKEGVLVLDHNHRMEDVQRLCKRIEKDLGLKAFQIAIHRDEGHQDEETGELRKNYHAHIVFDCLDHSTGKNITTGRGSRDKMSQLQDIVAEEMQMERGVSSNKKHLSPLQYKNKVEADKLKRAEEIAKTEDFRLSKKFLGGYRDEDIQELQKALKTAQNDVKKLKKEIEELSDTNRYLSKRNIKDRGQHQDNVQDLKNEHQSKVKSLTAELKSMEKSKNNYYKILSKAVVDDEFRDDIKQQIEEFERKKREKKEEERLKAEKLKKETELRKRNRGRGFRR